MGTDRIVNTIRYSVFVILLETIKLSYLLLFTITFLPIELAHEYQHGAFLKFLFSVIPFIMIGTLIGTLNKKNTRLKITILLSTVLATLGLWYVTGIFVFGTGMCGVIYKEPVFISRNDPQKMIVHAEFGCGATDSGPPVDILVSTRVLCDVVRVVYRVDTSCIDRKSWKKVEISNSP